MLPKNDDVLKVEPLGEEEFIKIFDDDQEMALFPENFEGLKIPETKKPYKKHKK